jgi:hypothetical protein
MGRFTRGQERAVRQGEIFERAAACERASQSALDPQRKVTLALLREMWIALANELPYLSEATIREHVLAVEKIHAVALDQGSYRKAGWTPSSTPAT